MLALAIACGTAVGLALGMTGGGGAVLAVPLLVYVLHLAPVDAVSVSLLAVGGTALLGGVHRLWNRQVDIAAGGVFALGGVLGAPAGTWLSTRLPGPLLLTLFALLVAIAAWRMWSTAKRAKPGMDLTESHCVRKGFSRRCVVALVSVGFGTGILAGLFGVGGGFVVVPALVTATGMGIHRAASTSLMVITLVSAMALFSSVLQGKVIVWDVALPFLGGGVLGLLIGTVFARLIPGHALQRGFAMLMAAIAIFILGDSIL